MGSTRVTVCLSAAAQGRLEAALDEALAPFEAMQGHPDERDVWDSWLIRGSSDGSGFWIAPGWEDDPRLLHDPPQYDGVPLPSRPGLCAGGPAGLLELSGAHDRAVGLAAGMCDLWQQLTDQFPPALPIETFGEIHILSLFEDIATRRRSYGAQPMISAFLKVYPWDLLDTVLGYGDDLTRLFAAGRNEVMSQAARLARRGTDLLTLDGWWVQQDGRATHGSCDTWESCAHRNDAPPHPGDILPLLAELPEDAIIVSVKCHT
ncbi:hypothetical protein [Catellatospora chokoriensis]|uniref:Uncharacterized protein n=1 Tax=Catellatospora chokoriensis TaxID=310353 RepID=A0A8J3KE94_9ACTN|nr:hypothetical protein [Catellatospora chokoriensis]GIF94339.1 hypothetical protein Cch02nite_77830 [Catellatospora chokoriensis]